MVKLNFVLFVVSFNFQLIMKGEVFNHEISYLSANCNRKPHAFDIRNNLLLYPSNLSICIYDFVKQKHVQLINGHTKPINCVRWIVSGKICFIGQLTLKLIKYSFLQLIVLYLLHWMGSLLFGLSRVIVMFKNTNVLELEMD